MGARVSFHVEHMRFELSVSSTGGAWFSLFPTEAASMPKDALFIGTIGPDMAGQLRDLADLIDDLLAGRADAFACGELS